MLGEIGIMAITAYGLYFSLKHIKTTEFKVNRLWNKAIVGYPSQTSIRNSKGHTFRIKDIKQKGNVITGRLYIPHGLGEEDFQKLIPSLKNVFYGKVELDNHYITITTGRKELSC